MKYLLKKHVNSYLAILLMEEILHQLIGSLSHYLQGFIDPRWCRISAINSITFTQCGLVEYTTPIVRMNGEAPEEPGSVPGSVPKVMGNP